MRALAQEMSQGHATEGWGTQPGWREVWRQDRGADLVLWFCGWSKPVEGLDAAIAFNEALFAGFPQLQQSVSSLIVEGDQAAYRHHLRGERELNRQLGVTA